MRLVVVKLGGSLLLRPDLPGRLRQALSEMTDARILLVVGGGAAADVVRDWSVAHQLQEEPAHWLAINSLALTRALIRSLMPQLCEVASLADACHRWQESKTPLLLDIEAYLRHAEPQDASPLPRTWDVTSDSIAAWVASRWSADELLLLKSIDLDHHLTAHQAELAGLVDNHFPRIVAEVPCITWCNLTSNVPAKALWLQRGHPAPMRTSPDPQRSLADATD